MKRIYHILCLFFAVTTTAQTAFQNSGTIRIHEGGNLGFHTHLINNSPFDTNAGLVGFYGSEALDISGGLRPQFFDLEIAVDNDVNLSQGVDVSNNLNFILGNLGTPLNDASIYLTFLDTSFYTGETDFSKIRGYAAISNQQNFIFPVGDDAFYRPLVLTSEDTNFLAKCAYFFEDPNAPTNFPGSYNTFEVDLAIEFVSDIEFWHLESSVPSTIRISWNERSDMARFTDDYTKIVPVGWSKSKQQWINLSEDPPVGTLAQGFVVSTTFIPNDYEIISLGVSRIPFEPLSKEVLSLENYFLSPNQDGINDSFIIPELEDYEQNFVQIFDRYGIKVFEKENYTDEFIGFSNQNNIPFNKESGLPLGIYYYTIYISDEDLNYQGFLYLNR